MFSMVAAKIYFHKNSTWYFPFLYIVANLYFYLFEDSHSDRCEVISHCGFDLHMLSTSYTSWSSVCLLWKKNNVCLEPLPILSWIVY